MKIEKPGMAWTGTITATARIPEADFIQRADVDCHEGGKWAGVVPIGMQPGQGVVVFLQDSVVPDLPETQFMKSHNWVVRMQRLRGCPSEVLILDAKQLNVQEPPGVDVTAPLGVLKYEKDIPLCLQGDVVGYMPSFIPKTDETNFQQVANLRAALVGVQYYATVKYDGTSQTFYHRDGVFGGCGRQLEYVEGNTAVWDMAKKLDLKKKLAKQGNFALQWECVGPGVQKNPLGLKSLEARLFDVYDIDAKEYLGYSTLKSVADDIDMPMAEIAYSGIYQNWTDDELREMARGTYSESGKKREGIVYRPVVPMRVARTRLSFKVINLDYKG